jgi:hypothetical protein
LVRLALCFQFDLVILGLPYLHALLVVHLVQMVLLDLKVQLAHLVQFDHSDQFLHADHSVLEGQMGPCFLEVQLDLLALFVPGLPLILLVLGDLAHQENQLTHLAL